MKKIILIMMLMIESVSFAKQNSYEVSPMIGYNIAENNFEIKDNRYLVSGVEVQKNFRNYILRPEVSIFMSKGVDSLSGESSDFFRGAVNGVYHIYNGNTFTPFVKLGAGYEKVSTEILSNKSGFFLDTGIGMKYNFTDTIAFKLEAIYMAKISQVKNDAQNNLLTLLGFSFAFGTNAKKIHLNKTPTPALYAKADDDNDGILNGVDKCLYTASNVVVDERGCEVEGDDDQDGIVNSQDICPETNLGEAVNSDGCSKIVVLNIAFEYKSFQIREESFEYLDTYADFLKSYTAYSSKIIGYTDDIGSEKYNQHLSQKRAEAVCQLLIARGVNPSQLSCSGLGEENPIEDNDTAEGRAQNRRIEAELTRN